MNEESVFASCLQLLRRNYLEKEVGSFTICQGSGCVLLLYIHLDIHCKKKREEKRTLTLKLYIVVTYIHNYIMVNIIHP